jgi:hypothetical protein
MWSGSYLNLFVKSGGAVNQRFREFRGENSGSDPNPYGWSHTHIGLSRNGEPAAPRRIGVNRCRKGDKRKTPGHRFLGVGR